MKFQITLNGERRELEIEPKENLGSSVAG